MAISMRKTKREPGELSQAEQLKAARVAMKAAMQRAADAVAALHRVTAKHDETVAAIERAEQAQTSELAAAQERLAVALADDTGDADKARAKLAELATMTEQRRGEAAALANVLQRRREERQKAQAESRKATRAYWRQVEQAELARIPDLDCLRLAYVAAQKGSGNQIAGFIDYLESTITLSNDERIRAAEKLEQKYGA